MIFWLALDFISLIALSFFSMFEMAAISFDRLKIDYYVARGHRRIIWLKELLQKPSHLFGTTLVGVNLSLVVGAECSRHVFSSMGLSPDWAPLAQITLAIILGELAPMFAARTRPEHVVFLGMPIIYWTYKLLSPFLFLLEILTKAGNYLIGGHSEGEAAFIIPREELVQLLEGTSSSSSEVTDEEGARRTLSAIFSLGEKHIVSLLRPIDRLPVLSMKATVAELRSLMGKNPFPYVLLKQEDKNDFVGLVSVRDFLRVPDNRRVRDWMKQPTFVDQRMTLLDLLNNFRKGGDEMMMGINETGKVTGFLTFEDLLYFLFPTVKNQPKQPSLYVDRLFDGETLMRIVEKELNLSLKLPADMILSDFVKEHIGDHPEEGARFAYAGFDWIAETCSLLEIDQVRIRSLAAP
jgi:CBS domain containing-hemolysin-like protein